MERAVSTTRFRGIERGPGPILSVLITQPDMRLIKFGYLVPLAIMGAGLVGVLASDDEGTRLAVGYGAVMFTFCTLLFFLSFHARLRRANYTVTTEYIEAQIGTVKKTVRLIPLGYVRDVTLSQTLFQSFFDTSDITVAATNGDRIVLENVPEGKKNQEIIWKLVLAKSPGRS